jgi:phage terminase large subunit-like protein
LASRPEGFVIYLTTQSDDPPAGVFRQKLQYARDVRDGKIVDNRFVPVIFEHPTDMVARKEHLLVENLGMVNPNLGYSVDQAFLEREFRRPRQKAKSRSAAFSRSTLTSRVASRCAPIDGLARISGRRQHWPRRFRSRT